MSMLETLYTAGTVRLLLFFSVQPMETIMHLSVIFPDCEHDPANENNISCTCDSGVSRWHRSRAFELPHQGHTARWTGSTSFSSDPERSGATWLTTPLTLWHLDCPRQPMSMHSNGGG